MERSRGAGQPPRPRLPGAGPTAGGASSVDPWAKTFWKEYFSPEGSYSTYEGYSPINKFEEEQERWGDNTELMKDLSKFPVTKIGLGDYSEKEIAGIESFFATMRKQYGISESADAHIEAAIDTLVEQDEDEDEDADAVDLDPQEAVYKMADFGTVDYHPCPKCGKPCECEGIDGGNRHWVNCPTHGRGYYDQKTIDSIPGITRWVDYTKKQQR